MYEVDVQAFVEKLSDSLTNPPDPNQESVCIGCTKEDRVRLAEINHHPSAPDEVNAELERLAVD